MASWPNEYLPIKATDIQLDEPQIPTGPILRALRQAALDAAQRPPVVGGVEGQRQAIAHFGEQHRRISSRSHRSVEQG